MDGNDDVVDDDDDDDGDGGGSDHSFTWWQCTAGGVRTRIMASSLLVIPRKGLWQKNYSTTLRLSRTFKATTR